MGVASSAPPSLACVRNLVRGARLSGDGVVTAIQVLGVLTGFPLWKNIVALRLPGIRREAVSPTAWALGWLTWAGANLNRLDHALTALTLRERHTLRRAIHRWWDRPAYASVNRVMTRILQTRFTALTPACAGSDGSPLRVCFNSEHLYRLKITADKITADKITADKRARTRRKGGS